MLSIWCDDNGDDDDDDASLNLVLYIANITFVQDITGSIHGDVHVKPNPLQLVVAILIKHPVYMKTWLLVFYNNMCFICNALCFYLLVSMHDIYVLAAVSRM
jgi:hypothetical protein